MEENQAQAGGDRAGVSTRSVEIAVALILFALGALVVYDSYRLGSKWGSDGPQSGYFPFYIGLLICIASFVTMTQAIREPIARGQTVRLVGPVQAGADRAAARRDLCSRASSSSGSTSPRRSTSRSSWSGSASTRGGKASSVGVGINALFFMMFEVWFKVPLFKGVLNPLGFLGY